jgi:hypothetical protein
LQGIGRGRVGVPPTFTQLADELRQLLRFAILSELPLHLARAYRQGERADFVERPAVHGVPGGHGRMAAIRLIVLHEALLLRSEHFAVPRHRCIAFEYHGAMVRSGEHGVGRVHPVRGYRAQHFVDLEHAFAVGREIGVLLVVAVQVHLDAVAEEHERIQPDVRLSFGTDGHQAA